ncbi:hypothetical protein GOA69_32420 [Sinorhizobium meliloti]|nr:hypothetical protein [Sinorhizobium meliloti]
MSKDRLLAALAEIWDVRFPGPENILKAPPFLRLQELCKSEYNAGSPAFSLSNALRALGAPFALPEKASRFSLPVDRAAERLDAALRSAKAEMRHLVPLDMADDLPELRFGNSEVRRFTEPELAEIFDAPRIARTMRGHQIDLTEFSGFQWLLIREAIDLKDEPEKRAMPWMYGSLDRDFGQIDPHKPRFPAAVEAALAFLMTAPWEEWVGMPEVDLFAFRVPWVHTVSDDLFVRIEAPPVSSTLSFTQDYYTHHDGSTEEYTRRLMLPIDDQAILKLSDWQSARWLAFERARCSVLFETPIEHFLVRAFATEGIDSFLAHMTAIEAALGMSGDFRGQGAPSAPPRKSAGKKMQARIASLVGRAEAKDFDHLYNLRSAFLHGRKMQAISTAEQIKARRIARLVVEALIDAANRQTISDRSAFLDNRTLAGLSLLPP